MGRGLTGGVILAGLALLIYVFTAQGRAVGDRGFSYLNTALEGVKGDQNEEERERQDDEAGGGTEVEVELDEPPTSPGTDPTPGPSANPDTGGPQNGGVVIEDDDDPQPGGVTPSPESPALDLDQGDRGMGDVAPPAERVPTVTLPPAGGRDVSKYTTTQKRAIDLARRGYTLLGDGSIARIPTGFERRAEDLARKGYRLLPNKKIEKVAPSPARQAAAAPKPKAITPAAQARNAKILAAEAEGRRQAATPGRTTHAPRKAGLYRSREEILAQVAAYEAQGRGLV